MTQVDPMCVLWGTHGSKCAELALIKEQPSA